MGGATEKYVPFPVGTKGPFVKAEGYKPSLIVIDVHLRDTEYRIKKARERVAFLKEVGLENDDDGRVGLKHDLVGIRENLDLLFKPYV